MTVITRSTQQVLDSMAEKIDKIKKEREKAMLEYLKKQQKYRSVYNDCI